MGVFGLVFLFVLFWGMLVLYFTEKSFFFPGEIVLLGMQPWGSSSHDKQRQPGAEGRRMEAEE